MVSDFNWKGESPSLYENIKMDNLIELEQGFIVKVEASKVQTRNILTRIKRVNKLSVNLKRLIVKRGSNRFASGTIKSYDSEVVKLWKDFRQTTLEVCALSKAICRLREVRRGKSKKTIEQILTQYIKDSAVQVNQ